jgi:ribokinase
MNRKPRVIVVGSLVVDLVFRVGRRPRPGETMPGNEFGMFLGGKGFNQAIAARRLGADVTMVGRVGRDWFGDLFLKKLAAEGLDARVVRRDPKAGTGVASPVVDENGENSIIGVPRANGRMTARDVDAAAKAIRKADMLMLQFEIPLAASARAAQIARKHGTLVMLDPAPVHEQVKGQKAKGKMQNRGLLEPLNPRPLEPFLVDFLVPNEVEAEMMAGTAREAEWVKRLRPENGALVVSLGAKGAMVADERGKRRFPAFRKKPVDTTGAGDAFRAGLAVEIARGRTLDEAVRFANACGALACMRLGAEPSMPRREAARELAGSR